MHFLFFCSKKIRFWYLFLTANQNHVQEFTEKTEIRFIVIVVVGFCEAADGFSREAAIEEPNPQETASRGSKGKVSSLNIQQERYTLPDAGQPSPPSPPSRKFSITVEYDGKDRIHAIDVTDGKADGTGLA